MTKGTRPSEVGGGVTGDSVPTDQRDFNELLCRGKIFFFSHSECVSPKAPLCVGEEDDDVTDAGDTPEGLMRSPPPSAASPPPAAPSQFRPASGKRKKEKEIHFVMSCFLSFHF